MVVGDQRLAQTALPPGKGTRYELQREGGRRTGLEKRNSPNNTGIRIPARPATSESLIPPTLIRPSSKD